MMDDDGRHLRRGGAAAGRVAPGAGGRPAGGLRDADRRQVPHTHIFIPTHARVWATFGWIVVVVGGDRFMHSFIRTWCTHHIIINHAHRVQRFHEVSRAMQTHASHVKQCPSFRMVDDGQVRTLLHTPTPTPTLYVIHLTHTLYHAHSAPCGPPCGAARAWPWRRTTASTV